MGLFNKKGKGKLRGFINKVKTKVDGFKSKHPLAAKALGVAGKIAGTALSFVPGGGLALKVAKGALGKVLPKMISAVQKSGKIDLNKIKSTLMKMKGKADPKEVVSIAKAIQAKTRAVVDVDNADGIEADYLAGDNTVLTSSGNNAKGSWEDDGSASGGTGSNGGNSNSNTGMMQKVKDWWATAPTWQKVAAPVGGVLLLVGILGATVLKGTSGKMKGKFLGKLRG